VRIRLLAGEQPGLEGTLAGSTPAVEGHRPLTVTADPCCRDLPPASTWLTRHRVLVHGSARLFIKSE
jgi:hypothetical protein